MKLIFYLAVVAILAISSAEAFFHHNLKTRSLQKAPPVPAIKGNGDLSARYMPQRIDNFNPQNEATYEMVIFVTYTTSA